MQTKGNAIRLGFLIMEQIKWKEILTYTIILLILSYGGRLALTPREVAIQDYEQTVATTTKKEITQAILNPLLKPVCACESSFEGRSNGTPQHFEEDGVTVRTGRVNPADRGICQINTTVHSSTLASMGLDVEKEADNITFANWLFKTQGFTPWRWSYDPDRKKCQWEE